MEAGSEAVVFEVARTIDGYEVAEAYRSKELGKTYAIPVLHEGHLYGFKGQFLTCIEAATGKRVWRSRPPGGRGLILVDGHLVIYGAAGTIIVAEATPEGYAEKAKLEALASSGYTWPSFADGKVFVVAKDADRPPPYRPNSPVRKVRIGKPVSISC